MGPPAPEIKLEQAPAQLPPPKNETALPQSRVQAALPIETPREAVEVVVRLPQSPVAAPPMESPRENATEVVTIPQLPMAEPAMESPRENGAEVVRPTHLPRAATLEAPVLRETGWKSIDDGTMK
jgi:hypothetical protein